MRMLTDFVDWYDHELGNFGFTVDRAAVEPGGIPRLEFDGVTWNRRADLEWSRRLAHDFVESSGMMVPRRGLVHELVLTKSPELVVYVDEFAHCGEGKLLFEAHDLELLNFRDCYATEFIGGSSRSVRLLFVGDEMVWVEYVSDHKWMSNVGDVRLRRLKTPGFRLLEADLVVFRRVRDRLSAFPLIAFDFVVDVRERPWVVDVNTAPGTSGIDLGSPFRFVEKLRNWCDRRIRLLNKR